MRELASKKRLDAAVFDLGLSQSREKARALIMEGLVYVDNQKSDKPGTQVSDSAVIEVRGKLNPYVSRGGLKLEKAMQSFPIRLDDKICMDVGASTGGFTDCMLKSGAKRVYAVDVGYGQLAWSLRTDDRVVNLERTNARYLTKENVPDEIEFTSIDVSFISLKIILPAIKSLLSQNGEIVCLIKPQFEAGRDKVGKKGVVRDKAVHKEVVRGICEFALQGGFSVLGLTYSPVKGPEGNIEYLAYLQKNDEAECFEGCSPDEVVEQSHSML